MLLQQAREEDLTRISFHIGGLTMVHKLSLAALAQGWATTFTVGGSRLSGLLLQRVREEQG